MFYFFFFKQKTAYEMRISDWSSDVCSSDSLGMLKNGQADALKAAGLDYYNHNLDTAPEFYGEVIHTRAFQDRLDTLEQVRAAGMKTCCGGIVGMGETRAQRAGLLQEIGRAHV